MITPDSSQGELEDLLTNYPVVVGYEMLEQYAEALHQSPTRFQPAVRERLESNYREADYERALRQVGLLRRQLSRRIAEAGVDALVLATTPWAAPLIGQTTVGGEPVGDALLRLCAPFSALGTPAVNVPVYTTPLPRGVQVVGTTLDEADLLALSGRVAAGQGDNADG